jgi:hypothetical protein
VELYSMVILESSAGLATGRANRKGGWECATLSFPIY